jgi:arylsulfatase A-like enzyme
MVIGDDGLPQPHRGFEHFALATHGGVGPFHYARWLREQDPLAAGKFFQVLDHQLQVNAAGGGDTDAPQVKHNDLPREWYHTEWVADRTIEWLRSLDEDADWFCWMSFPDPHHPWDPPKSELGRVNWRDLDLPPGYLADESKRVQVLDQKPRHWRLWYEGSFISNYEAPDKWVPKTLTADNVREVNAMAHIENELIDEAIGRVLNSIADRGWAEDVDVVYTTDHGEFQGDFGLLFKGPYHVDALMRLPLIWRPAPSMGVTPGRVAAPVGLVSLASTFASIAGLPRPEYAEAERLPLSDTDAASLGHERVLTEWDSVLFGKIVGARTICRDGWVCTAMLPGSVHDGTEGELYDLTHDPLQRINLWNDAGYESQRNSLLHDMWSSFPTTVLPRRPCDAPV